MIDVDELRAHPLFAGLSDRRLRWLREHVIEVRTRAEDLIVREGEKRTVFSVVLEGEFAARKFSGSQQIPTSRFVAPSFFGAVSLLSGAPPAGSIRAISDGRLVDVPEQVFRKLLVVSETFSLLIFRSTADRLAKRDATMGNQQKLAALGRLAAGLAHELNNPAAALVRTADCAVAALEMLMSAEVEVRRSAIPADVMDLIDGLGKRAAATRGGPWSVGLNTLTQSAAENALAGWLALRQLAKPWLHAPCLVSAGITQKDLVPLADRLVVEQFAAGIHWLVATLEMYSLMEETRRGSSRISEIIRAMKSYSHMDQAPQQEVDVHEGIEDTLVIMRHRLGQGIVVRREYDRSLPHLTVYGSELNQVWTNLIDNAIDAMKGGGELIVRTRRELEEAVVEFTDNGCGIPDEVMPHLFEPFYSTKSPGEGTGLGLDISYQTVVNRHQGTIHVASRPGQTTFQVRLPLRAREAGEG
ncbi:signal transduction histidine kinase [Paraburkholderia sp. RAU6.4a]|uniref:sensor histidine kinase n=1 Tax=Paraburkholderia sp. RAU6.4a TaxID=2991067 RepID=UPI003D218B9F